MGTTSDPKVIERKVIALKKKLEREINDVLPRKVGVIAVQHFRQNFREEGFVHGGLRPWQKSKRQLGRGKGASSRHKTLTSARNHLMNSTEARPSKGQVSIRNSVHYAKIHNEGGVISVNPTITPKMRRFAWAMYYKTAGIRKSSGGRKKSGKGKATPKAIPKEAQQWLGLALTKKTKLKMQAKMPKRQFIGESKELQDKVTQEIKNSIKKIKDGISTL